MFKKIYYTEMVGDGNPTLDYTPNIKLSNVNNYSELAAVFREYRINRVAITITCPYSIGQQGVGGNSLFGIYYKTRQTSNEGIPSTKNQWGEQQAIKRKLFLPQSGNAITMYFTPFNWQRVEVFPAAADMRDRKLYKVFWTMPTQAVSTMQYNGIIGQVYKVDGSNITSADKFQVSTKLYLECRGIM